MDLRADDDLGSTLVHLHDTQSASLLAGSLVDQIGIAELEAKASSAAVNGLDVLLATDGSKNSGGQSGEPVVASSGGSEGLLDIVILATRSHKVELGDGEAEHEVEDHEGSDAQRDDHPGVGSSREARGEQEVGSTSGEAEASTETNIVFYYQTNS